MSAFDRRGAVADLAARFASGFDPVLAGPRTVGREAEFPVVDAQGVLADVRELIPALLAPGDLTLTRDQTGQIVGLEGDRFSFVLEVGLGTLEVITGPCPDLHTLNRHHEAGVDRVVAAAGDLGWRVLGLGIQPLTLRSTAIMTPKPRYAVLHDVIGDGWLWFCLTASDQIHVDVDRAEAIPVSDLANLLAGVTIALCANSSIQGGGDSGWCSTREAGMGEIGAGGHRHGMPAGPVRTFEGHVDRLVALPFLIEKQDGVPLAVGQPFDAWMAGHGVDYDAFLLHEHYVWNSARPRSRQGTVELRAACQQPPDAPHAAAALHLALVEAHPALGAQLTAWFGADPWTPLRAWHRAVLRQGLGASEPVDGFLATVLGLCSDALTARGLDEAQLLTPLFDRLAAGENPAQQATRLVAEQGLKALLESRSFR